MEQNSDARLAELERYPLTVLKAALEIVEARDVQKFRPIGAR